MPNNLDKKKLSIWILGQILIKQKVRIPLKVKKYNKVVIKKRKKEGQGLNEISCFSPFFYFISFITVTVQTTSLLRSQEKVIEKVIWYFIIANLIRSK